MWNIVLGVIMIVGGLSGQLAIRGTGSSTGLAVLGVVLAAYGVYQMVRANQAAPPPGQ